jgi:hypothetical protein
VTRWLPNSLQVTGHRTTYGLLAGSAVVGQRWHATSAAGNPDPGSDPLVANQPASYGSPGNLRATAPGSAAFTPHDAAGKRRGAARFRCRPSCVAQISCTSRPGCRGTWSRLPCASP